MAFLLGALRGAAGPPTTYGLADVGHRIISQDAIYLKKRARVNNPLDDVSGNLRQASPEQRNLMGRRGPPGTGGTL